MSRVPDAPDDGRGFGPSSVKKEFSHYHKECPFDSVDIYRVLLLFNVTDPCLQHAIKKLLVAGGRGSKDQTKDIHEAIATLKRWEEMRSEERTAVEIDIPRTGPGGYATP